MARSPSHNDVTLPDGGVKRVRPVQVDPPPRPAREPDLAMIGYLESSLGRRA